MIQPEELIVDNFAGGGGTSEAIEQALGRPVDIAINHDMDAIRMHMVNHPHTRHLCEDVWSVDIERETAGRPVGLAWFSPDCKHFSKAKGGKPVEKKIRGLAKVALKWADLKKPRVIALENVEEFEDWGPLHQEGIVRCTCPDADSRYEHNRPCPQKRGNTFKSWVSHLRRLGYAIDWRELRACDYGAPTIRKRLFIVARRDSKRIYWPSATHGEGLEPYRTAADCIDWSIPCPSIFLSKGEGRAIGVNRPLAEATMRRIARGVKRYVIEAAEPFIVPIAHYNGSDTVQPIREPLRTITANPKGGSHALVMPFLGTYYGANREGGDRVCATSDPLRTQSTENRHALVSAFLAQHNAGANRPPREARAARSPLSTITVRGTNQSLVAAHMLKLRGTNVGSAAKEPLHTLSAGGTHHAEVRAFLMKYYGTDQAPRLEEPLHTIPTKDRFGLVLVHGEPYQIVDIGMRMLVPRELFRAQGFREDYIIDFGADGVQFSKTAQVKMCGNSVSPPPAVALIKAQFTEQAEVAA